MKKILIVISIILFVGCTYQKNNSSNLSKTPEKTACYQIQDGAKTIAFAHKYEWDKYTPRPKHYYFIYDLDGTMLGYIGSNGRTERYSSGKSEVLGNYTFKNAVQRMLDLKRPRIFPVQNIDIPDTVGIVIAKKSGDSKKESSKKAREKENTKESDFEEEEESDDFWGDESKKKSEDKDKTPVKKDEDEFEDDDDEDETDW